MPQARMLCQPSTGHHSTASALNSVSTTCSVRVRHGAAISGRAHAAGGAGEGGSSDGEALGTPRRRAAEPPAVCFPVRGDAGRGGPGGSAGGAAPARLRLESGPVASAGLVGSTSSGTCCPEPAVREKISVSASQHPPSAAPEDLPRRPAAQLRPGTETALCRAAGAAGEGTGSV